MCFLMDFNIFSPISNVSSDEFGHLLIFLELLRFKSMCLDEILFDLSGVLKLCHLD